MRTARQALADRFRFWRGVSGRRYVCSVFAPQSAPAYAPAVALYVRHAAAGPAVIAVGRVGEDRLRIEADEIHIHLVRGEPDLARVLRDLAALVPAGTTTAQHAA